MRCNHARVGCSDRRRRRRVVGMVIAPAKTTTAPPPVAPLGAVCGVAHPEDGHVEREVGLPRAGDVVAEVEPVVALVRRSGGIRNGELVVEHLIGLHLTSDRPGVRRRVACSVCVCVCVCVCICVRGVSGGCVGLGTPVPHSTACVPKQRHPRRRLPAHCHPPPPGLLPASSRPPPRLLPASSRPHLQLSRVLWV